VHFKIFQIFVQNPLVLAYGFTINRQFAEKTKQKSIFLDRDPHIPDRLHILVLAYGFTVNHQFPEKTDRKSVFLGHNPHMLDQLYIMVLYISFYGFIFFSNFRSNSIGVSLCFTVSC
jgi:hypothetical protein